jgi:hypothetical protein
MGCLFNATPSPFYPQERDPVPILQETGWAPEPVWMGAENLARTGFELRNFQLVAGRYTELSRKPKFCGGTK